MTPSPNLIDSQLAFLWVDMEFTGLDESDDLVLEIAAVATCGLFEEAERFTTFVHHDSSEVNEKLDRNSWWQDRPVHKASMLKSVEEEGVSIDEASDALSALAERHLYRASSDILYLAGNSVYTDRKWIKRDFPRLEHHLHYRMLDVSSLKLVLASTTGLTFIKEEKHRAMEDIEESIAELSWILEALRMHG